MKAIIIGLAIIFGGLAFATLAYLFDCMGYDDHKED